MLGNNRGCDEDIKATLVESMFIDDAKEWWFALKENLAEEFKQNWDVFQNAFGREYFSKQRWDYGKWKIGSCSKEKEVTSKLEKRKQCYKCKKFHMETFVTDDVECYFCCQKGQHKKNCLAYNLDKQVEVWIVSAASSIRR